MQNNIDTNLNLSFTDIGTIINTIEEDEKAKLYRLIENYENIVKANISNLKRMLDREKNKSIIIYNFGLLIELFLKMILLKLGLADVSELVKYDHHISDMYKTILNSTEGIELKRVCKNIKERSSLIKKSNGDKVNYNEYPDFRYNHGKEETSLIFDDEISKSDIKHVKEVIECIESLMK